MEQKKLLLAIVLSTAILIVFQMLVPHREASHGVPAQQNLASKTTPSIESPRPVNDPSFPGNHPQPGPVPVNAPRLKIEADRVHGSLNLLGAKLDQLATRDYHETADPKSPDWPLLIPQADKEPSWVQFGWSSDDPDVALPNDSTVWTASAETLSRENPVTLNWDNGAGIVFRIGLVIDQNYMFGFKQSVHNTGQTTLHLHPWARVRRDYTPPTAGTYILHEGPIAVMNDRLEELTYAKVKSGGADHDGIGYSADGPGGWAGITDKYMLTAIVADQHSQYRTVFRHLLENGSDRYQVDMIQQVASTVPPAGQIAANLHLFAGAKEVRLLSRYEHDDHIPLFSYAVDFGWFWFLTKPIFYALDWLSLLLGNFGLAILAFTVAVKLLFFPLANKSYRSMAKMKQLGPKMTALRERLRDEPVRLQTEMMGLYKTAGVNPAAGCLPMVVQIPVFFSLYKVIYVTIEMWHAPFYGWIHDLSVPDPTNIFTAFGALPFDPTRISPLLHLGIWPLLMGLTMFAQQKLNPPPPDPVQARLFQFMPIVFTFMLGRFPAGLVIYWTWNNLLTILQQWWIQRGANRQPRFVVKA